MGIESDQLVYDYLSRVGDLAQTALPAARRRELVAELRTDIERRRRDGDSPAAVRRILGRLGSPDDVVQAAARRPQPPRHEPVPEAPPRPAPRPPRPTLSKGAPDAQPAGPAGPAVPIGPGAAGQAAGPGPAAGEPEWWRVAGPLTPGGTAPRPGGAPAGWSGGLEFPDFGDEDDTSTSGRADAQDGGRTAAAPPAAAPPAGQPTGPGRRLRLPFVRRAAAPPAQAAPPPAPAAEQAAAGRRRRLPVGPVELVAALALLAGVVLGLWLPLGVGWLIAYGSRRLSRTEAKWAAMGVPGVVAAGGLVWLWGRIDGRWGRPLPSGQLGPVLSADFPVLVRIAAVASAAFLLWRSARRTR